MNKEEIYDKWSKLRLLEGLSNTTWQSEKQKLKQSRLNKLRRLNYELQDVSEPLSTTKEEIYDRWSKIGLFDNSQNLSNRTTTHTQEEYDNWIKNRPIQISGYDPSKSLLPISIQISARTIALGGWQQSEKQKLKQSRLNKLRSLNGEDPNIILPDDVYVNGLVAVQPLSAPNICLQYFDFKYDQKTMEHKEILISKIKYIKKIKNKNKQWMILKFLKKKL